jgi:hypothetical protein
MSDDAISSDVMHMILRTGCAHEPIAGIVDWSAPPTTIVVGRNSQTGRANARPMINSAYCADLAKIGGLRLRLDPPYGLGAAP